jgi:hypothetical protein
VHLSDWNPTKTIHSLDRHVIDRCQLHTLQAMHLKSNFKEHERLLYVTEVSFWRRLYFNTKRSPYKLPQLRNVLVHLELLKYARSIFKYTNYILKNTSRKTYETQENTIITGNIVPDSIRVSTYLCSEKSETL